MARRSISPAGCRSPVQKRVFFSHLYIKTIILPRPARDKHKENSKKRLVSADATPENSCLYLIPKSCDPSYIEGDEMEDADADPMAAAIGAAPRGFQDIRALPIAAGGAVFFTHRVIHWGSASRAGYPTPRIGKKTVVFVKIIYKNDHFAKTGSGQIYRKTQKECRFLAACSWAATAVRKTPFLASFLHKNDRFTKAGSGQT
eukprot:COSAG06_NODE_1814_length_8303_cov_3.907972_3_plen_202_part_00